MNRETIYAAAFAKFSGASGFVTKSRLLHHWSEVQPEEQPAFYQVQISEENQQLKGIPPRWVLRMKLFVYVHPATQTLSDEVTPSQSLNPLLDALEAALTADDPQTNACTLGGLVSRIWIDGTIETSEGVLGDQEVAIIPVSIVVPS